ncbi:MAG: hypothetical protein V4620_11215 [Bacteroidota bacterium]
MNNFFDFPDNWTFFKILTIWTVVLSSIISFAAYFIKDYFLNKWKSEQQKDISNLKAQLDKNNLIIGNITNSISSTYLNSNGKRIESIEKTWIAMMKIKKEIPGLAFIAYTILNKNEVEDIPKSSNKYTQTSIASFKPDVYQNSNYEILMDIEKGRPFIGENLWIIYFVYQAFIGRLVVLLEQGLEKGKVTYWKDDRQFIDQILLLVIKPEELEQLIAIDIKSFHNVLNFLESKALNDIAEQIMGKRMTEESVKHAIKLSNLTQYKITS